VYAVGMNWKNIIDDLLQRGFTLISIADAIGLTSSAVWQLKNNSGQQPRWEAGDKLLTLHRRVMRRYPRINDAA
jgi:transcriptional regulator with XRE-family HTH domain